MAREGVRATDRWEEIVVVVGTGNFVISLAAGLVFAAWHGLQSVPPVWWTWWFATSILLFIGMVFTLTVSDLRRGKG